MNDDLELIRQYAQGQSERAFETLVSRHIGLVHSAVMRQVRDPGWAEEITQSVFIILARKASSLGPKTILPGWLYRTTRYVSSAALKMQQRRERREQEVQMQTVGSETDLIWEQLAPALDEAMAQLRDKDRDALVLRFFHNKSLREVGEAFGVDEYAAQKRVSRGLDKLRVFFQKRGISTSTDAIGGAMTMNSIRTPSMGLAKSVSAIALAKGAAATTSTLALVKGTLKLMAWTKTKTAIIAGAVALLAATGTGVVAYHAISVIQTRAGLDKMQGAWEGTLHAGQEQLRLVFKIVKTNDTFYATMDSIDQGAKDLPVPWVRATSHSLHMAQPALNADYQATLSSDGTELSGNFVQFKKTYHLTLTRTANPDTVAEITGDQVAPSQNSDLQGKWQGALKAGDVTLRLNLRIAETSPGTFEAQMDSIDQGAMNIPVTTFTYQKPDVHFEMASINGGFAGKLNSADDHIAGTWKQAGRKFPLTFARMLTNADETVEVEGDYGQGASYQMQGHWKGALAINGMQLHIVFNIALMPDGSFSATLDSPDQGAAGVPATSAECTFPNVKLTWKAIGGEFTGKMNNGKLTGAWHQGKGSFPLELQRDKASPTT